MAVTRRVVDSVVGDPKEGADGALYEAPDRVCGAACACGPNLDSVSGKAAIQRVPLDDT